MKLYDIAFRLSGKLQSDFPKMFDSANDKIRKVNNQLENLNKVKLDISKYEGVKKSVENLKSNYADLSHESEILSRRYQESELSLKGLENSYITAAQKAAALKEEFGKGKRLTAEQKEALLRLNQEAKQAKVQFDGAKKENKLLGQQFSRTKTDAEKLKAKLQDQYDTLYKLKGELKGAGINTKNLAVQNEQLARQLDKVARSRDKYSKVMAQQEQLVGQRMAAREKMLTAAEMFMVLKGPTSEAIKFQSAMADVKKVVDFDTPQQFNEMSKDIMNLTKKIPMTADALAAITANGGQLIKDRKELVLFTGDAAKMGVAFGTTAEEAGQTMAQWRSGFKMNRDQVLKLADQINYLGNTTAASAPRISEVVKRIGPLGSVGGAAASSIAALGATMVGAGIEEEIAATGIKNLILNLTAGAAATKGQKEALEDLGFSATGMAKAMQKDANGAILQILESIQKLPKEKQASILTELFGKESVGSIAPLLTNLDGLKENLIKVGNASLYAGSMQKEFEGRSNTAENKLQLMQNSMKSLGISVGTIFLPGIQYAAEKAALLADAVQGFVDKHPNLSKFLIGGTAGIMGLTAAVLAGYYAFTIIKTPFLAIKGLMVAWELSTKAAAAAQWLWNAALNANPIGITIIALAALGGAVYAVYKHWDRVRVAVTGFWEKLNNNPIGKFVIATNPLLLAIKALADNWDKVTTAVKGAWDWLSKWNKTDPKSKELSATSSQQSMKTTIGHNATGTKSWRGGPTWVGERGPELLNLQRGAEIIPNNESMRMINDAQMGMASGISGQASLSDIFSDGDYLQDDSSAIQMNFSPNINITGDGDSEDIMRKVEEALRIGMEEFKKELEEFLRFREKKKERVSLA